MVKLLLVPALMAFTVSSCDKATDDYKTLPNSKWEAKMGEDINWGVEIYFGFIENKKITLKPTADGIVEYPSFQRNK